MSPQTDTQLPTHDNSPPEVFVSRMASPVPPIPEHPEHQAIKDFVIEVSQFSHIYPISGNERSVAAIEHLLEKAVITPFILFYFFL